MKLTLFKKTKKFHHTSSPYSPWLLLLGISGFFFILICVGSVLFFLNISSDTYTAKKTETTSPDAIQKEKLEKILTYFVDKATATSEIESSLTVIPDPFQ